MKNVKISCAFCIPDELKSLYEAYQNAMDELNITSMQENAYSTPYLFEAKMLSIAGKAQKAKINLLLAMIDEIAANTEFKLNKRKIK